MQSISTTTVWPPRPHWQVAILAALSLMALTTATAAELPTAQLPWATASLAVAAEEPLAVTISDVPAVAAVRPAVSAWMGKVAVEGAHVRAQPNTHSAVVDDLQSGQPVVVQAWVAGEQATPDNPTWARFGNARYIHSSLVRPAELSDLPDTPWAAAGETGRWIDLNLTQQVAVAYEDGMPVHVARVSSGRPGWETSPGVYHIQRRVADETMTSSTLAGPEELAASYRVEHVRWTQYFSADGKALHENYWKSADQIGVPSSHGCAGMIAEDAQFFWDWATVGTPIYAHV